jgi:hypothetical protein
MTDEKALRVSDYLGHVIDTAERSSYTAGMARQQESWPGFGGLR